MNWKEATRAQPRNMNTQLRTWSKTIKIVKNVSFEWRLHWLSQKMILFATMKKFKNRCLWNNLILAFKDLWAMASLLLWSCGTPCLLLNDQWIKQPFLMPKPTYSWTGFFGLGRPWVQWLRCDSKSAAIALVSFPSRLWRWPYSDTEAQFQIWAHKSHAIILTSSVSWICPPMLANACISHVASMPINDLVTSQVKSYKKRKLFKKIPSLWKKFSFDSLLRCSSTSWWRF